MKRITIGCILSLSSVCSFAESMKTIPQHNDITKAKRLDTTHLLSYNLYHEARSESDLANIMILNTVFNRVENKHYPSTVEEVVLQKWQYSWVNDKKSDYIKDEKRYKELYKLVEYYLTNKTVLGKLGEKVDHYHTKSVSPKWKDSVRMKELFTIGEHVFYRRGN